jgi:hypothetical protein
MNCRYFFKDNLLPDEKQRQVENWRSLQTICIDIS